MIGEPGKVEIAGPDSLGQATGDLVSGNHRADQIRTGSTVCACCFDRNRYDRRARLHIGGRNEVVYFCCVRSHGGRKDCIDGRSRLTRAEDGALSIGRHCGGISAAQRCRFQRIAGYDRGQRIENVQSCALPDGRRNGVCRRA